MNWGLAGIITGLTLWGIYERVRCGFEMADHDWTRWELARSQRDLKDALRAKDRAEGEQNDRGS